MLLLAVMFSPLVYGEANAASPATPTGRYTLALYEMDGEDLLTSFIAMADEGFDPNALYLEFLGNERCTISMGGYLEPSTYKLDGNALTIIDEDGYQLMGTFDADADTVTLDPVCRWFG